MRENNLSPDFSEQKTYQKVWRGIDVKQPRNEPILKPKSMRKDAFQTLVRLYPFHEGNEAHTNQNRIQNVLKQYKTEPTTREPNHTSRWSTRLTDNNRVFLTSLEEPESEETPFLNLQELKETIRKCVRERYAIFQPSNLKSRNDHLTKPTLFSDESYLSVRLPTLVDPLFKTLRQNDKVKTPRFKRYRTVGVNSPPVRKKKKSKKVNKYSELEKEVEMPQSISYMKMNVSVRPKLCYESRYIIPERKLQVVLDDRNAPTKRNSVEWEGGLLIAPNTPKSEFRQSFPIY